MASRYDVEPTRLQGKKDLIEHFVELRNRVDAKDGSLQIGHTAIEDGNLIVRNGDIEVRETDGTLVLQILHGNTPEVRMYPLGGNDTHRVALFGFDYGTGITADQAFQAAIEKVGVGQDGGKLLLTRSIAVLSHQPATGSETFFWINPDPTTEPGLFWFSGHFPNKGQFDSHQALYTGSDTVSSGVSTWTHTYFTAFSGTVIPIVTVDHGSTGTTLQWNTDSYGDSSFTVRFSSTTFGKTVNFWVVKIT